MNIDGVGSRVLNSTLSALPFTSEVMKDVLSLKHNDVRSPPTHVASSDQFQLRESGWR